MNEFSQPWVNDFYFLVRDLGFPIVVAAVLLGMIYKGAVAVWERFSPLFVEYVQAAKAREEARAKEHREQTQIMGNLARQTLKIQESNSHSIARSLDLQEKSIQLQDMTYNLMSRMTKVGERTADAADAAVKATHKAADATAQITQSLSLSEKPKNGD